MNLFVGLDISLDETSICVTDDDGKIVKEVATDFDAIAVACEDLDSCISMVKSGKDRMRNNVSEPLGWACAGRILLERNEEPASEI